ncbi:hypothetical protein ACOSQ4_006143 [Xanthoceras sorbifolium]
MEEETIEGCAEKDPISNLAALEDSKAFAVEADNKTNVSQGGALPENLGLLSSSLATEEETTEGCSEKDPVSNLVAQMDSKECVAEAYDKMDQGGVMPEMGLPSSSLATEEEKMEGWSEKEVSLDNLEGSVAEDQKDVCQAGGAVPENISEEKVDGQTL